MMQLFWTASLWCIFGLAWPGASGALQFELPALRYPDSALEPIIDTQTMIFHHNVHHKTYVQNLNKVLSEMRADNAALGPNTTLTELVQMVGTGKLGVMGEAEAKIRNNAGGAWNHALFWRLMSPVGDSNTTLPPKDSAFAKAAAAAFGSVAEMVQQISKVGQEHFGSGWVFLVYEPLGGRLRIIDTPNQDSPLSPAVTKDATGIPILGLDVWEHAYYLKYGPSRATFIDSWWKVLNWRQVELNYKAATDGDYNKIIGPDANKQPSFD